LGWQKDLQGRQGSCPGPWAISNPHFSAKGPCLNGWSGFFEVELQVFLLENGLHFNGSAKGMPVAFFHINPDPIVPRKTPAVMPKVIICVSRKGLHRWFSCERHLIRLTADRTVWSVIRWAMSNHTDTAQNRGHAESPAQGATVPEETTGATTLSPAVADMLVEMNWPWPIGHRRQDGTTVLKRFFHLMSTPDPEFFALFQSLVDAGADFHAKDKDDYTILAHAPNLLEWLPCFEACGLDLTDPVQQAIHGSILSLCLGAEENTLVLELIRRGLFPTPETDWGAAALERLANGGDRLHPIRAVIDAKTARERLCDVLPEVPLPPVARRL
jgi:hypothetical protein